MNKNLNESTQFGKNGPYLSEIKKNIKKDDI
jgi:hypothetical protein